MWNPRGLLLAALAAVLALAQPAPEAGWRAPVLKPGEGLAISLADGPVQLYGEATKEAPMGSLAKLVWMKLEGAEWASQSFRYRCTGTAGPYHCWNQEGHGRVDVGKALAESCNLAFLTWAAHSAEGWVKDYGEGAARMRMEEAFEPFLGRRLPPGDTLPPLTPAWVGDGDLLRTSPEAMLRWLIDPMRSEVIAFCKRYLAGTFIEFNALFGREPWWFKTGTAPVPGEPGATTAWVAGGRGSTVMVLRIPRGRGKQEGLARFKEIMGLK